MKTFLLTILILGCFLPYSYGQELIQTKDKYDTKPIFAIKTQPLQILNKNFKISYEHSLAYNSSVEVEVGVRAIPLLLELQDDGSYFSVSSNQNPAIKYNTTIRYKKFSRESPDKLGSGKLNPLSGLYIAGVLSAGTSRNVNFDDKFSDNDHINQNEYLALMIDLGVQKVASSFIADFYVGGGYSHNTVRDSMHYNNSHTGLDNFAIRAGFRLGFSFLYDEL